MLGRTRKTLKFNTKVMKTHLDMDSMNEIILKGENMMIEMMRKEKVK